VPAFTITASIIGNDWASEQSLAERRDALAAAGAVDPRLDRGEHLVGLGFELEAESEEDGSNRAHRVLLQAVPDMGWMITAVEPAG
jgi:hypothetical protein